MEMNLSTLGKHFSDEGAAWELVEKMRWPDGPVCPRCGDRDRAYFGRPNQETDQIGFIDAETQAGEGGKVTNHRQVKSCGKAGQKAPLEIAPRFPLSHSHDDEIPVTFLMSRRHRPK